MILLVSSKKPIEIKALSRADLLEAVLITDWIVYGEYLRANEANPLSNSPLVSLK
jgi:hypothetical protein